MGEIHVVRPWEICSAIRQVAPAGPSLDTLRVGRGRKHLMRRAVVGGLVGFCSRFFKVFHDVAGIDHRRGEAL